MTKISFSLKIWFIIFSFSMPSFAQSEFKISKLILSDGQVFTIPSGTEDIAFSNLEMKTGSQLVVPADTSHVNIVIDYGIFHKGSSIISQGSQGTSSSGVNGVGGTGQSAASMTLKVNQAKFLLAADGSDLGKPFFLVSSSGGNGGIGGPGARGGDARRKSCNGADGGPAGSGGAGARGGTGGNGGSINFYVKLISGHPLISNNEIALSSIAGEGGAGGRGGAGGAGAAEKCCGQVFGKCTFKRGGYGPGGTGPTGPTGFGGTSIEPVLELDFE